MPVHQSRLRIVTSRSVPLNIANAGNEEHFSVEKARIVFYNGAGTIARRDNAAASFAFPGRSFKRFCRGEAHLYNLSVVLWAGGDWD